MRMIELPCTPNSLPASPIREALIPQNTTEQTQHDSTPPEDRQPTNAPENRLLLMESASLRSHYSPKVPRTPKLSGLLRVVVASLFGLAFFSHLSSQRDPFTPGRGALTDKQPSSSHYHITGERPIISEERSTKVRCSCRYGLILRIR